VLGCVGAGLAPGRARPRPRRGGLALVARLGRAHHHGSDGGDAVHPGCGAGGGVSPAPGDDGAAHRRRGVPAGGGVHGAPGHHRVPVAVRVVAPGVPGPGGVRPGPVLLGGAPGGRGVPAQLPGVRRRGAPVRGAAVRAEPPGAVHGAVRVARRLPAARHGGMRRPGVHPHHRAQGRLRRVPPAALRQAPILLSCLSSSIWNKSHSGCQLNPSEMCTSCSGLGFRV
jgi:hypothetical protein